MFKSPTKEGLMYVGKLIRFLQFLGNYFYIWLLLMEIASDKRVGKVVCKT